MARQIVVLALIFFAIVGMASATAQAPAASSESEAGIGPAPDNHDIGLVGGSGADYGAAPIGGPVTPGTFSPGSPAEAPNGSGSTILEASAVAGLVVSAIAGSFFF
nr:anther-specific protein BCP1-like [Coffea arabica]